MNEQDLDNLLYHSYTNEKPSLYKVMNDKAKNWWANTTRVKQRATIKENVRALREARKNGGYAVIAALGGHYTIVVGDDHQWSGGRGWESLIAIAYLVGLPVIDFRPATTLPRPMPIIGNTKHGLDCLAKYDARVYVPLAEYIQQAKQGGATILMRPQLGTLNNHYFVSDYPEWIASRRRDIGA